MKTDPIYVAFEIDEQTFLRLGKQLQTGKMPVLMGFSNERGELPHRGKVEFVDNRVSPATNTLLVKAVFPNPNGEILPGFSARVRLVVSKPNVEMLIPTSAVRREKGRPYVLVVGVGNTIELRPVALGPEAGGRRVVTTGVEPADRVIINDIAGIAPGMPIRVREADPPK